MAAEKTPVPARQRPVQRHLMTPGAPRRQRKDPMSLGRVQRWVLSTLAVTTILHLAAGLVVAAIFIDADRLDSRIGLLCIAAAFGVISVAAGLAIHNQRLLSPWLLLGTLPAVIGSYFVFWA